MDAQVKAPCQAVAVRYMHDLVTGETLNIGVVVLCPARGFARARFLQSWGRITAAFPRSSPVHLRRVCAAIAEACDRWVEHSGELFAGTSDVAALVREALTNEAGITLSPTISGVTSDPERTLGELFDRNVGRYCEVAEVASRDDADIWQGFARRVRERDASVLSKLQRRTLSSREFPAFRVELEHAWKNASWHAVYPLSLDLTQVRSITLKVSALVSHIDLVAPRAHDTDIALVVGLPSAKADRDVRRAAEDAVALIEKRLRGAAEVVPEEQGDTIAAQMVRDLTEPGH